MKKTYPARIHPGRSSHAADRLRPCRNHRCACCNLRQPRPPPPGRLRPLPTAPAPTATQPTAPTQRPRLCRHPSRQSVTRCRMP